jgi:tryptophan synthase alpha chain
MINFKNYIKGKKAFVPFVTAGDPNLETTKDVIKALIKAGASIIEIGIPFSDPIAEGNTIMEADIRALASGTTVDKIFEMVKELRKENESFPFVFMTYLNPVFSYGYDRFFKKAQELNMLGIIIPDMPYEEKKEAEKYAKKYNQKVISLIAPTSEDRIKKIAEASEGFIYLVSSLGVTGVRNEFKFDLKEIVNEIRKYTNVPVAIGFGISKPEHVKSMCAYADGVIVGSAIVRIVEEHGKDAGDYIYDFCKKMVEAAN